MNDKEFMDTVLENQETILDLLTDPNVDVISLKKQIKSLQDLLHSAEQKNTELTEELESLQEERDEMQKSLLLEKKRNEMLLLKMQNQEIELEENKSQPPADNQEELSDEFIFNVIVILDTFLNVRSNPSKVRRCLKKVIFMASYDAYDDDEDSEEQIAEFLDLSLDELGAEPLKEALNDWKSILDIPRPFREIFDYLEGFPQKNRYKLIIQALDKNINRFIK